MSTQELRNFIAKEQKSGKSRPEIVKTLLANGWQQADIDLAFVSLSSGVPLPPQAAVDGLKPFMELIRESWAILKHRLWSYIAIAVIPTAVGLIGSIVISGATATTTILQNPTSMASRTSEIMTAFSLVWIVIIIVSVILAIMSNLALFYLTAHWDEPIGFREAYAYAWKRFGQGLWVQLLVGAAIYGGMLLLAIPGIIASLALMFSMCVFVAEDTGGFEALLRSHAYVYKRWWAIWWRMFLLSLMVIAAMLILWLPAILTLGTVWTAFIILWQCFSIIFTFQLYKTSKATAKQSSMPGKRGQYLAYVIIGALVIVGALIAMASVFVIGFSGATTNINLNINSVL